MNSKIIGKWIKHLREQNNLTQEELAKECGVTYQAVSKWQLGKNIPKIAIIKKLSLLFKISIEKLLE